MATNDRIKETKDYSIFHRSAENRQTDISKHKRLLESMKRYGFLRCFPIVVHRDKRGRLIVDDGQHRLAIAESLGLPVYYVEEDVAFDIALINCTAKTWKVKDYVQKYCDNGNKEYQDAVEFAEKNNLPLGTAFCLLGGTASFGNVKAQLEDGTFKIKDRKWAESVAGIYVPMVKMEPALRKDTFVEACMAVCRVKDFNSARLLKCAERCREKLVNYGTREAYLDMLEEVYNYGQSKLLGLKALAMMAMRSRNAVNRSIEKKQKRIADAA